MHLHFSQYKAQLQDFGYLKKPFKMKTASKKACFQLLRYICMQCIKLTNKAINLLTVMLCAGSWILVLGPSLILCCGHCGGGVARTTWGGSGGAWIILPLSEHQEGINSINNCGSKCEELKNQIFDC